MTDEKPEGMDNPESEYWETRTSIATNKILHKYPGEDKKMSLSWLFDYSQSGDWKSYALHAEAWLDRLEEKSTPDALNRLLAVMQSEIERLRTIPASGEIAEMLLNSNVTDVRSAVEVATMLIPLVVDSLKAGAE